MLTKREIAMDTNAHIQELIGLIANVRDASDSNDINYVRDALDELSYHVDNFTIPHIEDLEGSYDDLRADLRALLER